MPMWVRVVIGITLLFTHSTLLTVEITSGLQHSLFQGHTHRETTSFTAHVKPDNTPLFHHMSELDKAGVVPSSSGLASVMNLCQIGFGCFHCTAGN